MIERFAPGRTGMTRLASLSLTVLVGAFAIAAEFHSHGLPGLERASVAVPSAAPSPLLHHDCLACKIAPPLGIPSTGAVFVDPGLVRAGHLTSEDFLTPLAGPALLAPPRGPPVLPRV